MTEYSIKERIAESAKRVYERISTKYRMARFDAMAESGELEEMCTTSRVHQRFRVRSSFFD